MSKYDVGNILPPINLKYTAPPTVAKFMRSNAFHRAIMGPIGSGKSAGCCVEIFRRCVEMPPWNPGLNVYGKETLLRSSKWAVIRNTNKQLYTTTLDTWLFWMRNFGKWQETKMTFHLKFGDVDAKILFLPLDTQEDKGRILSLELTGAFVNEFRELPVPIFADIKGRLRRYPNPTEVPNVWYGLIMDTNPPEIDSDAFKLMEHLPQEEGNENSIVECDTFKQPSGVELDAENTDHLHPQYYTDLAKGQTTAWVDTYIHGKYSPSMSGKPVYSRTFNQDKHVSKVPLKADPELPVIISFDCGLTPAATFKQMTLDGRVKVLREAVEFDMGMKRFSKLRLRPIIKNFFPNNPLIFIGDPAGKRRADSDESSAFKVLKDDYDEDGAIVKGAATNDPKVRIEATEHMLSQYPEGEPLMIIDPSCKTYIEALRSKYRYPKKKLSGEFSDSPEKNNWSHIAEAGQYGDLYLLSGKYDPADHMRVTSSAGPFNPRTHYRPAQREGY